MTGRRVNLRGMKTEKLSLLLRKYSNQRVCPVLHLGKTVELALVMWVQVSGTWAVRAGKMALLLVLCFIGWARQGSAGELIWMLTMKGSWQDDQPSYYAGLEQGLIGNLPQQLSQLGTSRTWGQICRSKATWSLGHKATKGYPRRGPVRADSQQHSQSQKLWSRSMTQCSEYLQVKVY